MSEEQKVIWDIITARLDEPCEFIPPEDWIVNGSYSALIYNGSIDTTSFMWLWSRERAHMVNYVFPLITEELMFVVPQEVVQPSTPIFGPLTVLLCIQRSYG